MATATAPFRQFSSSVMARKQSSIERDLENKLIEELKFENEEKSLDNDAIRTFMSKGLFKVETKLGEKEVTLVRTYGNEKISVIFSTDALSEEPTFDEEATEEEEEESVPISLTVLIEKTVGAQDKGALELTVTLQDRSFFIDAVHMNPSSTIATDQTAEGDWKRRGQYGGPVFEDLDQGLQDMFSAFLEERGFDDVLADFVPAYIQLKEQTEYKEWLKKVGEWVAAK